LPTLHHSLFFVLLHRPPTPTLFPYTTLFRSGQRRRRRQAPQPGRSRRRRPEVPHRLPHRLRHAARWLARLRQQDRPRRRDRPGRSEEHTSELQSLTNLVCRLLLEKKKNESREHVYICKSDDSCQIATLDGLLRRTYARMTRRTS